MSPIDIDDINSLLLQTLVGETGRHRRAALVWRRTGPEAWDVYGPGQCPCGAAKWRGLSLDAAADILIARLEVLERIGRGGMQLA